MNKDLVELLQQQLRTSSELLNVLEQESQAVMSGNLEHLQSVGQAKEHCCQALSDLERNWPPAMRGSDARSWIAQQGEEASTAWDQLIDELRRCRRQNDANGMLIAERQQWVARKLSADDVETYGAAGETAKSGVSTWASSA